MVMLLDVVALTEKRQEHYDHINAIENSPEGENGDNITLRVAYDLLPSVSIGLMHMSGTSNATSSGILSSDDNIYRFTKTVTQHGVTYKVATDYNGNKKPNGNERGRGR